MKFLIGIALMFMSCSKANSEFERYIEDQQSNISELKAVYVQKNDSILANMHFSGTPFEQNDIRSVAKSVLSLLIGIAIDKGYIKSLDEPVQQFIRKTLMYSDAVVEKELTLRHLLTMSSGFDWDESKSFLKLEKSHNPLSYVVKNKIINEPGKTFKYNSGVANLVAKVLHEATKMSTEDFARQYLFEPLGIEDYSWEITVSRNVIGGYGLKLTLSDQLKIGQLVSQKGIYNNKEIVSSDYIEQATKQQIKYKEKWGSIKNLGYGFLWWTGEFDNTPVFFALGHGGQYIFIFPESNLIICTVTDLEKIGMDPTSLEEKIINFICELKSTVI